MRSGPETTLTWHPEAKSSHDRRRRLIVASPPALQHCSQKGLTSTVLGDMESPITDRISFSFLGPLGSFIGITRRKPGALSVNHINDGLGAGVPWPASLACRKLQSSKAGKQDRQFQWLGNALSLRSSLSVIRLSAEKKNHQRQVAGSAKLVPASSTC